MFKKINSEVLTPIYSKIVGELQNKLDSLKKKYVSLVEKEIEISRKQFSWMEALLRESEKKALIKFMNSLWQKSSKRVPENQRNQFANLFDQIFEKNVARD